MNPQLLQYAPHCALTLYAVALIGNMLCRMLADRRDHALILRVWEDTGDLEALNAYAHIVQARRNRLLLNQSLPIREPRPATGDGDSRPPPTA